MRYMNPFDIKTAEPFKGLFPIDATTLNAVAEHMRKHGYDPAQPLAIWYERDALLDGHTRLAAAQKLKFTRVPVVKKEFRTENQAVEYAIHCQRDRRNLSDADLLRWVEELRKRRSPGRPEKICSDEHINSGLERERLAKVTGQSATKVQRAMTVQDQADDETKAKVASGEMSINKAYNETRKKIKVYTPEPGKLKSKPDKPATQEPVDQVGNPLPRKESIRTAFQRRGEITELMTTVSRLKSHVLKVQENDDPLFAELNVSRFQADCGNLHRALRAIRPHAVCPYCQAQGCKACLDRGWVGEFTYEHAPKDMKGEK